MSASNKHAPVILVVDDQDDIREAMRLLLIGAGYRFLGASSPDEALRVVESASPHEPGAALVDMNYRRDTTSGEEGLALIAALRESQPQLPVIAMTAWASVDLAVEAMRRGAVDFIEKPWQNARVLSVLRSRVALADRDREVHRLSAAQALRLQEAGDGFVVESHAMRKAVDDVMRIADSDANILLLGENGTGKSHIAELIHRWSPRRDKPFVKINLGGIAPSLFEAEMFGHVRGAYTDAREERIGRFELADGGTLFLDEIGNLPFEQQPKLLRAIEDGEFERLGSSRTKKVDVRIVAATNANLIDEAAAGRFRQDLLYRIDTFRVRLPALRERRDDILPIARYHLDRACRRYGRPLPVIGADAERALLQYAWPGNVRELAHAMERAALLASSAVLGSADLRLEAQARPVADPLAGMTLEQAEAWLMRRVLDANHGNLQRTAEQLGITRQSLYRRLHKHGLRDEAERQDAG